jgi:DNA-binding MarR family transcriptional regulator
LHVQRKKPFWNSLPGEHRAAWYGFLRAHTEIVERLDTELEAAHGLALRSYDVLVQLSQEEAGELRMFELADEVVISRSGLTRLAERLERRGFVERRRGDRDPRMTFVRITPAGLDKLAEATPTHVEGVRRLFLDKLSTREAHVLAAVFARLRGPRG